MLHNLVRLTRYRGLIQSLVARELKARYRGSVLGFFWSFINPLLLLLIYTFVFKYFLPRSANDLEHYELFLFCGLLPWTWFSSSLLESSGVLISGGNLIKKVLFPAEVLPIVTVLANMVHFFLGLPILALFLVYNQWPVYFVELIWFPVVVLVQLVLTLGFALVLSALTVHFRDLRDILSNLMNFWFFATPIIYPYTVMYGDPSNPSQAPVWVASLLKVNPFTHLAITYQEILYFDASDPLAPVGPPGHWFWLLMLGLISVLFFLIGYFVFDRLRDTFAEEV
jgi:ABC-type polysaccharide/polyol phosphate export permease